LDLPVIIEGESTAEVVVASYISSTTFLDIYDDRNCAEFNAKSSDSSMTALTFNILLGLK